MTHALLLTLLFGSPLPVGFEGADPAALVEDDDRRLLERLAGSAWATLDTLGIDGDVTQRVKSAESLIAKMARKGVGVEGIHDRLAVRIKVDAEDDCYRVLDELERRYTFVDGELDDYIRTPKPSGYQSLHTAVELPRPDGSVQTAEFQIRTHGMHAFAERGPAAHHLYKQGVFGA